MRHSLTFPAVLLGLGLIASTGCESPQIREAKLKMAAVHNEQERYLRDSQVNQRVMDVFRTRHHEVLAVWDKAKLEGKRMTAQRLVKSVAPAYPIAHTMSRKQGQVWIGFVIGTDGLTTAVEAIPDEGSINDILFVESAKYAVRHWIFEPAKLDGVPTATAAFVPVVFQIPF